MMETPLRGWKEIAACLGTSARTAQRWERELGLPIHRTRDTTGSVVNAYRSELDAWMRSVAENVRRDHTTDRENRETGTWAGEGTSGESADSLGLAEARPHAPQISRVLTSRRVAGAALIGGLAIGAVWLFSTHAARPRPAAPWRTAQVHVLVLNVGSSEVRVRFRADELASLKLPGGADLAFRAVQAGSELTVEFFRAPQATAGADGTARIGALRLKPRSPGELSLPGSDPIRITWEPGSGLRR